MNQENIRLTPGLNSKQSQTVWFDVTDVDEFIKNNSSVTGIQRVVSMLVLAIDALDGATTAESNQIKDGTSEADRRIGELVLCRYDFNIQTYVTIPRAAFQQTLKDFMSGSSRDARRRTFTMAPENIGYLRQKFSQFVAFLRGSSLLRQIISGAAILIGSGNLDRLLRRRQAPVQSNLPSCCFQTGDAFVALGAFWFHPFYINIIISNCHAYSLRLFLSIFDLIPIRFSKWFPPNYADVWSRSVELALRSADCAISISRFGEQDLLAFCRERGIPPPRTAILRLGDEIALDRNVAQPAIEKRVARYLAPGFVLVVSSIDVRKNQQFLIDVWERLYRKHGFATPYLILVGKPGTGYLEIMVAMQRAKFVDGRIVILHDVGDRELLAFYRHARFTMLPSLTEGWGLPIAESMAQGKMCIASNAASIPEIAGPLAEYFDAGDAEHCYQLVEQYAFNAGLRSAAEARIKEQYRPTTWATTARSLLGILESTRIN